MNHRKYATIAGITLAAVVALGCGAGSTDTGSVSDKGGSNAAPAEEKSKVAKMGSGTVTFKDGLAISTKAPKKFTPAATAAGHQRGNTAVLVEVTISNGSKEPVDLALVTATAAFGAEGTQAESVIDVAKGITGFEGTLAPGQKRTTKLAFSAATKDTSKIALTVSPSFDGSTALFEGSL
ncbi:DUF4352 domain-containing protein [Micromonospora sp. RTP1Z1]|uniref:DUF4352 domain-containing protein n=1 Tax=Micromonospora sp. RTP1Z1 TaxID=2994043 RepID=UPI0029C7D9C5|nr:DUF4352 domain-containing protein [Micromonospora sp. RTP1Z1]